MLVIKTRYQCITLVNGNEAAYVIRPLDGLPLQARLRLGIRQIREDCHHHDCNKHSAAKASDAWRAIHLQSQTQQSRTKGALQSVTEALSSLKRPLSGIRKEKASFNGGFFNAVSWRGSTQMEQLIASSHWTDSSALTKARETWQFSNWSHSRQAMVASKGNDCRIFKFLPWASLLSLVA